MKKGEWIAVSLTVGAFVLLFALVIGSWVIQSHFEAAAFNRATGKNVSTWDAMWIELRVQEGIKEEEKK